MNRKFSPKVKKIIGLSRSEAIRLGHDYIGTEHLLLGMLQDNDNLAVRVLDAMDVDFTELKFKIEDTIAENRVEQTPNASGNVPLNRQAERVLKVTFLEAKNFNFRGVWFPEAVNFLKFEFSDDAAFITGQTISVSGGLTMHG